MNPQQQAAANALRGRLQGIPSGNEIADQIIGDFVRVIPPNQVGNLDMQGMREILEFGWPQHNYDNQQVSTILDALKEFIVAYNNQQGGKRSRKTRKQKQKKRSKKTRKH